MLKRLLFVTPFALRPATEGHRKRMAQTLEAIRAHGYQVDILFISKEYGWSERFNRQAFREMAAMADNFFHVHQPTPADPAGATYTVDEWWNDELDRYCEWLFANNGYETIFCNYVFMSRVFESVRYRTRRILETHDVFTGRKEMLLAHGLRPEFFHTSRLEERKGIKRADTVVAIKDEEAEFFHGLTSAEVVTLPFVEPAPPGGARVRARAVGDPVVFGFFGSANSLNVQAVSGFADHLARTHGGKGWEVHLYGSVCSRLALALPDNVKAKGLVAEPRDFYAAVDGVINFQEVSTGLKIKIAEALAYGTPLISLAHAFEGFGRPAHPAQNCADLSELVGQMDRAAADPAYLHAIGEGARTVQQALADRTGRMAARLFGSAETDPAMLFVVDGALHARSAAYRHLVASFRLAFVRSWAACLFVGTGTEPQGEYRAFADGFGRVADEGDLAALAPGSVLLLFTADALPPETVARFARVVVVEAACDYAAPGAARRLAAAVPGAVTMAHGRGDGPAGRGGGTVPAFTLSMFRWMPWDLAMAQRPQHFRRMAQVWLIGADAPDERLVRLFRSLSAPRALQSFGEAQAAEVHRLLFDERLVPDAVVAVGPCRDFALAIEWLAATGVEVRRFDPPGNGAVRPAPFLTSASALVRPLVPGGTDAPRPLGDWHASGWADLAEWIGLPRGRQSASASTALSGETASVAP